MNDIFFNRSDGVVVKASALHSVDLGFTPLVESCQTVKNGIHSFLAWRLAFKGCCREQAGKFACCVFGQSTYRDAPIFTRKTGGPDTSKMEATKRVRTSRPKDSDTTCFLVNGG